LAEIGKWMRTNGDAIYGTSASPFRKPLPWGRCTQKPGRLFLLVFDWPAKAELELPLQNPVQSGRLLAEPGRELKITRRGDAGWVLHLPATAPDPICSVIELRISGQPKEIETAVAQRQN
jgi:alpha-L-fucosidase